MIKKDTVLAWLAEEGWSFEDHEPPETVEWAGVVTRESVEAGFVFFSEVGKAGGLVIQRQTKVGDVHKEAISQLPDDRFREFMFNLTRDLLLCGAQYRVEKSGNKLDAFHVVSKVYPENLSKVAVLEAIQRVLETSLMGVLHIQGIVGDDL